jgi:hypothetical protein
MMDMNKARKILKDLFQILCTDKEFIDHFVSNLPSKFKELKLVLRSQTDITLQDFKSQVATFSQDNGGIIELPAPQQHYTMFNELPRQQKQANGSCSIQLLTEKGTARCGGNHEAKDCFVRMDDNELHQNMPQRWNGVIPTWLTQKRLQRKAHNDSVNIMKDNGRGGRGNGRGRGGRAGRGGRGRGRHQQQAHQAEAADDEQEVVHM